MGIFVSKNKIMSEHELKITWDKRMILPLANHINCKKWIEMFKIEVKNKEDEIELSYEFYNKMIVIWRKSVYYITYILRKGGVYVSSKECTVIWSELTPVD